MKLKNNVIAAVAGSVSLLLVGCGQSSNKVELRRDNGLNQLFAEGQLVYQTTNEIKQYEGLSNEAQFHGVLWKESVSGQEVEKFVVSNADGKWGDARMSDHTLRFKSGTFKPVAEDKFVSSGLSIVQFKTTPLPEYQEALEDGGIEILDFLHGQAILVRGTKAQLLHILSFSFVRWVGSFDVTYKMSSQFSAYKHLRRLKVVIVPTSERAMTDVLVAISVQNGKVYRSSAKGMIIEAEIAQDSLLPLAANDYVAWMEPLTEASDDMDLARIQGGADFLTSLPGLEENGYTGVGIKGHIMEGIDQNHPDFAANDIREKPIAIDNGDSTSHGQSTYGIVFGDGSGDGRAKGILPNGQGYYTNYDAVYEADPESNEGGRYELVGRLVNEHNVLFQTASWGYARTLEYDARSAEMDRLIFDHDIPITQSQSNACNRQSRPQAWAKNIISVGAVYHYNNADKSDDKWKGQNWSCASIGPATDGRIKPDLVAYYDDIWTTGMGDSYRTFGGTSGATPIVAGYLGLSLEMYTNGVFGELEHPLDERFKNRPHFTTSKALLINTASQYDFGGEDHDLTRVHQGWGFPSVKQMYEIRDNILIVNEEYALKNLEEKEFEVVVSEGAPELKVTMTYADPVGSLSSNKQRVNDLNLKVISPEGDIFWGNNGLRTANYSVKDGEADSTDTVENVFVQNPASGTWIVKVIAQEVVKDAHRETEDVDADFALVVSGITR